MSNYGIPYMGSKAKICKEVCSIFPPAENFYDLFGGGFSISHFMLKHRSKNYKQLHFNELRPGICDLIKDAIAGKYNYNVYQPPWISREDFFARKEIDPMIKIIWSFGNNGDNYLFGKDIEQNKKSMHMAVVFNEFDKYAKEVFVMEKFREGFSITDKRLFLKNRIKLLGKNRLELQQLERLERLQQLQQLERLQQLQQLEFYNTSYENVPIKPNSVIYCDPPYKGTCDYGNGFDTEKFLDWADARENPVYISEYNISDSRFKKIGSIKKRSLLAAVSTLVKYENIYVNKAGLK